MTTPPGHDPYGQQPPPPPNPYGTPSYGAPGSGAPGYGAYGAPSGAEPPKTDGVSIASFVLSLLCCTGLIGLILGFVGLARTKGGKRKGRWAAVAGIVLGGLTVIAVAGFGGWLLYERSQNIAPGDAEVGQCMDVEEAPFGDEDTVALRKKDCSENHNAEIVYVGEYGDIMAAFGAEDACRQQMDDADEAKVDEAGEFEWGVVLDDPDDPDDGDPFVCYIKSDNDLDSGIL